MILRPLAFAVVALFVAVPALAASSMMSSMANSGMSVNLTQQNSSHQDGSAMLKNVAGGVWVKVMVKNEPAGASEPAHIHQGTCAKLNPVPWKPLSNVVNGMSVTTVHGVTVAQLKQGMYAINVHQSAANLKHYVSCGDL